MTLTTHDASAPAGAEGPRTGVDIVGLRKRFRAPDGTVVAAVDDVTLHLPKGDFCVLLGPSGCGKTTLLRCLAGLEHPDEGRITIDGVPVFGPGLRTVEPQDRPVGMVFQSYALWPNMTVADNVAFPLTTGPRRERMPKEQIRARVEEVLKIMGLSSHGSRAIGQLSGGQQQRVALARAIVAGTDVVLFDEPLSNIDAKVREILRRELRAMQQDLGFTAVYVTHDQAEAMELADQITVMRSGRVMQNGSARDIYERPRNRYVAEFIGTANLLPVTSDGGDARLVHTAVGPVRVAGPAPEGPAGAARVVASRAHRWWIDTAERPGENAWPGEVAAAVFAGSHTEYVVRIGETSVRVWAADDPELVPGRKVWVGVDPAACVVVLDHD
ncbi:ABC transporter ATP-binding protein [Thermobifida cellulosilytica]|uniref:Spermidine/putrescine ABC transporter ATPase n=1 Tax=Thermobifida cellulosilytica TB100 TaxID=665004 RepID=A0A147KHX6_THECS|nr:ABC transporter ATP-binding protein [Thermobifida cellulosilytica]KUP96883.1 spermidine/putrescine ABC transporter ATPase [Thermobifida cellulosilytica TB100]